MVENVDEQERNIVVVSSLLPNNKIFEYTPIGRCIREIQVDAIDGTIYGLKTCHSVG